tara:strand:- start:120 stop:605 length:486 start_codon:yes stop_codon:yes gene_type:complete
MREKTTTPSASDEEREIAAAPDRRQQQGQRKEGTGMGEEGDKRCLPALGVNAEYEGHRFPLLFQEGNEGERSQFIRYVDLVLIIDDMCKTVFMCLSPFAKISLQCNSETTRKRGEEELAQLRWITLGYHYDWTHRTYSRDVHTPFPFPLADLCTSVAQLTG